MTPEALNPALSEDKVHQLLFDALTNPNEKGSRYSAIGSQLGISGRQILMETKVPDYRSQGRVAVLDRSEDNLYPTRKDREEFLDGLSCIVVSSIIKTAEKAKADGMEWDNDFFFNTVSDLTAGSLFKPLDQAMRPVIVERIKYPEGEEQRRIDALLKSENYIVFPDNNLPLVGEAYWEEVVRAPIKFLENAIGLYTEAVRRVG